MAERHKEKMARFDRVTAVMERQQKEQQSCYSFVAEILVCVGALCITGVLLSSCCMKMTTAINSETMLQYPSKQQPWIMWTTWQCTAIPD